MSAEKPMACLSRHHLFGNHSARCSHRPSSRHTDGCHLGKWSDWESRHAILSQREGIAFDCDVTSDTAPLHSLVSAMRGVETDLHVLRDPTRGGVAAALHEIAETARVNMDPSVGDSHRKTRSCRPRSASVWTHCIWHVKVDFWRSVPRMLLIVCWR